MVYLVADGLNCLNEQRLIAERFRSLDEDLVKRDRKAIKGKSRLNGSPQLIPGSRQAEYLRSRFDLARTLKRYEAANGGRVVR